MSLYNRLTRQLQPADWEANHTTPDKNTDWYRWHIAVHPLVDLLILYINGDLGIGNAALNLMQGVFDLSDGEKQQLLELYTSYIDDPSDSEKMLNLMSFQGVIRAMERGIPQSLNKLNTETKFNTWFGIVEADDRGL